MRIITYGNSFTRVALLAAALFLLVAIKTTARKTHATEVTVLEGKTMGTFWRASIPGIDAKRSAELKRKDSDPAGRRRSAAFDIKDSA